MTLQTRTTARAIFRRLALPSFAAGLVALTLATSVRPAIASTGDNGSGAIVYTAAPGEVNNVFAFQSGGSLVIWDQGTLNGSPITVTPGGTCAATTISNPNDAVVCPDASIPPFLVNFGDRNDLITVDPSVSGHLSVVVVDGGTGDDAMTNSSTVPATASYADATNGVTVDLATSSPQNTGQGSDSLSGFRNLFGSAFDDTLSGDGNANTLNGGPGNDTLGGRVGNDSLVGGGGVDTASYTGAAGGVSVDLNLGGAQAVGGGEGSDTLSGISNLLGSNFGDTLTGNGSQNTLNGRGGDDTLNGGSNDDTLIGGLGNDSITGGGGTDTADYSDSVVGVSVDLNVGGSQNTGDGFDTLTGITSLTGSSHDDFLEGDGNNNTLSGGAGNDDLQGRTGSDFLDGGAGVNTADYSAAAAAATIDLSAGEAFQDGDGSFDFLTNIQNVIGTSTGDVIVGDSGSNTIQSFGGSDVVAGAGGDDTLDGGTGSDTVTYSFQPGTSYAGSPNPVTVNLAAGTAVGEGSDSLAGFETVTGSALADTLIPGSGGSTLQGAGGNDALVASGGGSDVLDGGPGTDTVDYSGAHAGVDVDLRSGFATDGEGGFDVLVLNSIENVTGSPFNDTIQGDGADNQLAAGGGTDTVSYSGAPAGVTIDLKNGTATGDGSDTLSGFENATGSEQADGITGSDGPNVLSGAGGGDSITGGLGSDTISGGTGDDVINAKDKVADTVTCGDDTDTVTTDKLDSVASDCELINVAAPKAVTGSANSITSDGATLTATVNPNGLSTTVYFEYGRKKHYGMTTSSVVVKGRRNVPVGVGITGLSPGKTYHFRVVAVNAIGTTYGRDSVFVTTH